jgi:mevalonate kinase
MLPPRIKNELQEKVLSWFWVVLFISAILFLRSLLVEMHTETVRIAEERKQLERGLEEEREKSRELYEDFYAEINRTIQKAIEAINEGKVPK